MFFSSPAWDAVTYWALDLETGGLDGRRDPVLAAGMAPIRAGAIRMAEAWQTLVRPDPGGVIQEASMRAHHLLPADLEAAPLLCQVLDRIDARLRQGALLVHGAAIDLPFLRRAYRACGRRWPRPPVIDTTALLFRLARQEQLVDPGAPVEPEVELAAARRRLGLPGYARHDPLLDAVAAAELFLVLRSRLGARRLRDLV